MTIRTAIHAAVWGPDWRAEALGPTLAAAARIGYDHVVVPLRQFDLVDPPALARVFATHGLAPLNTCGLPAGKDIGSADPTVRAKGIAHLRQAIALARDMGSLQIGGVLYGPLGKAAGPAGDDQFARAADAMHGVGEFAATAGVRLALEVVNRYETALLFDTARGLAFLEAVGLRSVMLHLDTFHMSIEEPRPFAAIVRAIPHLAYFELDQSHRGDARDGSLDLAAWCAAAARAGYDGIVGVEAFTRQFMTEDHADLLAIWNRAFEDGTRVAENFMGVIRQGFGT